MKIKFITAMLAISLFLTACASEKEESISSEDTQVSQSEEVVNEEVEDESEEGIGAGVGVVSPYIEVNSSDDFKLQLDIDLKAPEDAQVAHYIVVSNSIAQINYAKNNAEYTLRASYTQIATDLHGVHGEFVSETSIDETAEGDDIINIDAAKNSDGVKIAMGTLLNADNEILNFTLTTSDEVSLEEIMADLLDIIISSI